MTWRQAQRVARELERRRLAPRIQSISGGGWRVDGTDPLSGYVKTFTNFEAAAEEFAAWREDDANDRYFGEAVR